MKSKQSEESPWEKPRVKRTRHACRVVPPVRRHRFEELIEIVGRVIVEKNLELRELRIVSLALTLLLHSIKYALHCMECVRPDGAA